MCYYSKLSGDIMEKKELYELCDFVINNDDLTTKNLRNLGFSYRNQRELINNNVLQRVRIGHYKFIDYSAMLAYGRELLKNEEFENAFKCFDKAHEIDRNSYENTAYFLSNYIYQKDYVGAYNCLKPHLTYKNINHTNNLYLFLLSHLIKLPDGNSDYVKHFDFDDLVSGKSNKSKKSIEADNQIAYSIIHGHFQYAIDIIQKEQNSITNYVTYKLLCNIIFKNRVIASQIKQMVSNKEYDGVISLLEEEQEAHLLTDYHNSILSLCYDIKNMKENKEAIKSEGEFFDTSGNVYGHNYELAKKMARKKNHNDFNTLCILLDECINLRDYTDKINQGIIVNYFTLAYDLYTEDYDSFFDDLHFYLYGKDMLEHEKKFTQLVEMHKKEEDKLSLIPMKYLELIEGNDSPSIRNFFIDRFNSSINSKNSIGTINSNDAELYFDIISQFSIDNDMDNSKKYQKRK